MSLLENYIKDLNQMETAKRSKRFTRIHSIDFVKGFAITLIILAHTGEAWINQEWRFAYAMLFPWLDVFGPSLFIFLSAVGVVFSLRKKEGFIPEKTLRNSIYIRALVVIALGVVFNIATNHEVPFPLNIWGWNILMFIGFAQIICYYSAKIKRMWRVVLGITILIITFPLRQFLILFKDTNPVVAVIHYILISPAPHNPFIPYAVLAIFSTIFAEMMFEAMMIETKEAYYEVFRQYISWGLVFILLGIFFGRDLITTGGELDPTDYRFVQLIPIMNEQPYLVVEGIPRFLIRGTSANLMYSLGMALIILGVVFYFIDYKHLEFPYSSHVITMFVFFGRVSLTLFFFHYIGLFFYYHTLGVEIFFFIVLGYIGFLGMFVYLLNRDANGIGTFERLMGQMGGKKKKK